jgi:hypothetical protein
MELKITCEGSAVIDYKTIKNLQGSLKTRTIDDIEQMIKFIIQDGFSFPMFLYKHGETNYAIDGYGRLLALSMMENIGYRLDEHGILQKSGELWTIPLIPCDYIEAKDLKEARIKLLKLNSEYGSITQVGFQDFTKDIAIGEYEGIPLRIVDVGAMVEIDPLGNIGNIIPGNIVGVSSDKDEGVSETDFKPALDPTIDMAIVTDEAIQKAIEKEHEKKGPDVSTMQLVCKHCGRMLTIRKTDVKHLINQKIKELNDD